MKPMGSQTGQYVFETQLVTGYSTWRRQRLSINGIHERLDAKTLKMADEAMETAVKVLGSNRVQIAVMNMADESKHWESTGGEIGHLRLTYLAGDYIADLRRNLVTLTTEQTFKNVSTASISFLTQDDPIFGTWIVTMSRLINTPDGPTKELLDLADKLHQLRSWVTEQVA